MNNKFEVITATRQDIASKTTIIYDIFCGMSKGQIEIVTIPFGCSPKTAADILRDLADRIEMHDDEHRRFKIKGFKNG